MSKRTLTEIRREYREQGISYDKNPDKTPDEIIREITDSQVDSSVVEEAQYQCYMNNVVKILGKLGEYELATLVNRKLRKHVLKLEYKSKVEIVEPVKPEKEDYWLPYWTGYLRRIPKQGLNNLTRGPRYSAEAHARVRSFNRKHGISNEWKGKPTLPRRLKSICIEGFFGGAKLPFFYYHMEVRTHGHEIENWEKIQELTKQIIVRLEELYYKMDTVHILPEKEVRYWKKRIWDTILYIREKSKWVGLELLLEVGGDEAPLLEQEREKEVDQ